MWYLLVMIFLCVCSHFGTSWYLKQWSSLHAAGFLSRKLSLLIHRDFPTSLATSICFPSLPSVHSSVPEWACQAHIWLYHCTSENPPVLPEASHIHSGLPTSLQSRRPGRCPRAWAHRGLCHMARSAGMSYAAVLSDFCLILHNWGTWCLQLKNTSTRLWFYFQLSATSFKSVPQLQSIALIMNYAIGRFLLPQEFTFQRSPRHCHYWHFITCSLGQLANELRRVRTSLVRLFII